MREKIARTESKAEQTVELANDIKEGTKEIQADTRTIREDTRDIQADTRTIKDDLAVSRSGIALMEASQATFIEQIRKMQKNMETLLQENSRKKECKNHQITSCPISYGYGCSKVTAMSPCIYTHNTRI